MSKWRAKMHEIIYEADTPAGKAFDVALIAAILISLFAVMLESVASIRLQFGSALRAAEWIFTLLFTVEYLLRLVCVARPLRYAFSFFGLVDLLAIAPTYLSLVFAGAHSLLVIRCLRLLRVFRIFKLGRFLGEANELILALKASRPKIIVFLGAVLCVALIMGTLMYMIEGEDNGFESIPQGIYWAIVTMTTVGYGDLAPLTDWGKAAASVLMILGYGIIAVPTGIVTAEIFQASTGKISTQACPTCSRDGHDADAEYCKFCGSRL